VNAVAFSSDGTLLASAGGDGVVRLWNPATGQASGAFSGLNEVAFSPDGSLLAAGQAGGTLRRWDLTTRQAVGAPLPAVTNGAVSGVAFSPDGKLLATADTHGTVRLWQMPLYANPYAALCADVGPPTQAEWTQYAPGEPQPSALPMTHAASGQSRSLRSSAQFPDRFTPEQDGLHPHVEYGSRTGPADGRLKPREGLLGSRRQRHSAWFARHGSPAAAPARAGRWLDCLPGPRTAAAADQVITQPPERRRISRSW
jgi:hypothetical protein